MLDSSTPIWRIFLWFFGLEENEIENAKKNSDTTDIKLQAASVLRYWRKSRGNDATRQAVITALETCGYNEAVEMLKEKWKMTSSVKGSSNSSCSQSLVIDFHATFSWNIAFNYVFLVESGDLSCINCM